ncbi:MAG TPA: glycosyltransferase [Polyangiaceae bacterium]
MTTSVLQLTADPPDEGALGGIQVHVATLARAAASEVTMHTAHSSGGELRVHLWSPGSFGSSRNPEGPGRLVARLPLRTRGTTSAPGGLESAITAAIVGTGARVLHAHSPLLGAVAIANAARRTSVRLAVTLHDHSLVCENYDLLERGERFCGIPTDLSRCDLCLQATLGRPSGAILEHRDAMRTLVSSTDAFVAPSDSVLDLVRRVHPIVGERAHRIDWGVPASDPTAHRGPAAGPGPLAVAVVGVLSREKGRERLPALLSACRDLPLTWHFFGATEGGSVEDLRRSAPRVVIHGAYRRPALAERLHRAGCHLALLPSIKPESFSLVLSEVLAAGLPVVVSDLGALPERVVRDGFGWAFDPFSPLTLSRLLADLSTNPHRVNTAAAHVRARPERAEQAMADDHVALWTALRNQPERWVRDVPAGIEDAWVRGVDDATREREHPLSRLVSLVTALRGTDFYRDLPLRRALPESTRKAVEAAIVRLRGFGRP